ncbi:Eukaryotic peptide chain release factor GTP-binding subunit [Venturia nashicola]|uniref:Eukaryotic peptide chain release factor GTP-binding subunit n=1 Tax=Venturia nashicola TaxID=86259 RepID=A0A4Z1NMB1_9PEZI|nr:Eukaryotic peptide chain release factor GTP-binding subunit [Venturia nashicola]TLD21715.1 Eukaryotic peptide chain release factor GTP-binding subunit [Venturia nashicola]
MIGTTTTDYIFIRVCIFAIRAVTPLCMLLTVLAIVRPPHTLATQSLLAYATLETAFYFLVFLPRKASLQSPAEHPPIPSREFQSLLYQRCKETISDPGDFLRKWFLGADLKDIKWENVKDFYRWGFLNTADEHTAHDEELDVYVQGVEELLGKKLEPGRGSAKCLRLTVDPVEMTHRPIVWYFILGLLDCITATLLTIHGFTYYHIPHRRFFTIFPWRFFSLITTHTSPSSHTSYWYRRHTSKTRLPVLFIHGIGVGLYPYMPFLAQLQDFDDDGDGEIGIIAIEIAPLISKITNRILPKKEMMAEIDAIVTAHGWDKFVLVSHSYGTVISTYLHQDTAMAAKIGPTLLVDPVNFLLHLPDVAYNFTAKKPVGANELQLWFFAAQDMGIAHVLRRHFFWTENILWKEDIEGRDVTVSLSGKDLILDTEAVGRYVTGIDNADWRDKQWTGKGLDILWFPDCDHASVFDESEPVQKMADIVRRYARSGAKSAALME